MTILIWIATALAIAGAVYSVERVVSRGKRDIFGQSKKMRERVPDPRIAATEERNEFIEILGDLATGHDEGRCESVDREVVAGVVHVLATFKNTIVTVTDEKGAVLGWSSAGKLGIKGGKKSKAFTAKLVSQDACRQATAYGLKEVSLKVKGPGPGREAAVSAVSDMGFEVRSVEDVLAAPREESARSEEAGQ